MNDMPKISDFCGYCGVPLVKADHPMAGMKHKNGCDRPSQSSPVVDPWIKVGTTTIDGTLIDIVNVLDVSTWPINWDRDAVAAIDLFMRADEPWLLGGRNLVAKRSHVNEHAGTALIHCDIVRRQSEIEAEGAAKQAEFDREVATMETRDYPHGLPRPPCPECGPHGNRGEVLLASSWAKCTTCAGGKTGDIWGEVRDEPLSAGATITNIPSITAFDAPLHKPPPSFMDARRDALASQHGQYGFKLAEIDKYVSFVSTFSTATGETLDNFYRLFVGDNAARRAAAETDDEYRQRIRSNFGVQ